MQRGVDEAGKEWARVYHVDYGFIPSTAGGDDDELDVFVGRDATSTEAFWIIQKKPDGSFDEYKLMLGFRDADTAKAMYLAHVPKRFFGAICATSIGMLKALLGLMPSEVMKAIAGFVTDRNVVVQNEPPSIAAMKRTAVMRLYKNAGAATPVRKATADGLDYALNAEREPRMDAISPADHAREDALYPDRPMGVTAYLKNGANIAAWGANEHDAVRGLIQYVAECAPAWKMYETPPFAPAATPSRSFEQPGTAFRDDDDADEDERSVRVVVEISKAGGPEPSAEGELRYALGIVLEPDVVDAQGDTYNAEEIRRAMWGYMKRKQNLGLQHERLVNGRVHLVESYQAPSDMVVAGTTIKAGTWLMGLHFEDDTLWNAVRAGKFTGLSIGGFAKKNPV